MVPYSIHTKLILPHRWYNYRYTIFLFICLIMNDSWSLCGFIKNQLTNIFRFLYFLLKIHIFQLVGFCIYIQVVWILYNCNICGHCWIIFVQKLNNIHIRTKKKKKKIPHVYCQLLQRNYGKLSCPIGWAKYMLTVYADWQRVRSLQRGVLDMTLTGSGSETLGSVKPLLHSHYSQIQSDLKVWYLLESHQLVK